MTARRYRRLSRTDGAERFIATGTLAGRSFIQAVIGMTALDTGRTGMIGWPAPSDSATVAWGDGRGSASF